MFKQPFFSSSLQWNIIITKLKKSLKDILICWKLKIFLKSQNKVIFSFNIPKELTLGGIYEFL